MNLLVCGDRFWPESDRLYMYYVLDAFHAAFPVDTLIEGEAPGADRMSREWADSREVPWLPFPAEWEKYRPSDKRRKNPAGAIRNRQMLREGKPEYVLAFHRRPSESRGTADMVSIARGAGIEALWVPFDGPRPWWSPLP